jgi:hypothetical protein
MKLVQLPGSTHQHTVLGRLPLLQKENRNEKPNASPQLSATPVARIACISHTV